MALILVLQNVSPKVDGKLSPISDYNYEVMVGDGTVWGSHRIAKGEVKGHTREDGWKALVERLLQEEGKSNV